MSDNNRLARLRGLLWQMEVEVGLEQLTQSQRDVYYAACLAADSENTVHSEQVRLQPLAAQMARPTFYRALKELVTAGFMCAASEARDGRYRILR